MAPHVSDSLSDMRSVYCLFQLILELSEYILLSEMCSVHERHIASFKSKSMRLQWRDESILRKVFYVSNQDSILINAYRYT